MTSRFILLSLVTVGCAETQFAEGPALDPECADRRGIGAGNGQGVELGRLQNGVFVPLVGGETLELAINGDPYGWSFFAAVRLGLESAPSTRDNCMTLQTAYMPTGAMFPMQFISPGHPATWVEDPSTPSLGRWMSDGEARLVIGSDVAAVTAAPLLVSVFMSVNGFTARSPDVTLRFENREGFLAD